MIKKLKFKIICLSMISLFVLLAMLLSTMNLINYRAIANDADQILTVLSENKGRFPERKEPKEKKNNKRKLSPEAPYESRYFTVVIDSKVNVTKANTSHIKSVNTQEATEYGKKIYETNKTNGFIDIYRYHKTENGTTTRIIFLDCRKQLDAFNSFLFSSITMSVIGFIIVFIIIFFASGRIIRPIAESYEKQKRFITDAGHEIKTPLTIISANVDILEAENGKSEHIEDIRTQSKRLSDLTNELVYLSKMEEETKIDFFEVPLSEIIKDTAENFRVLALTGNRNIETSIEPMLSIKGNIKELEEVTGILLENAIKYSPENSIISLNLTKKIKNIELTVANKSVNAIDKESMSKIFDRFYRCDLSRNSETGGYGIGLSIAKAIVQKHSGKIRAEFKDNIFKVTIQFPA